MRRNQSFEWSQHKGNCFGSILSKQDSIVEPGVKEISDNWILNLTTQGLKFDVRQGLRDKRHSKMYAE